MGEAGDDGGDRLAPSHDDDVQGGFRPRAGGLGDGGSARIREDGSMGRPGARPIQFRGVYLCTVVFRPVKFLTKRTWGRQSCRPARLLAGLLLCATDKPARSKTHRNLLK